MRITIFDYCAGNLHSIAKALDTPCAEVVVQEDSVAALETDVIVLPGVGAFAGAAERLSPGREAVREALRAGLPAVGICLGMQLLFDASDEGGGAGLGLVAGRVRRLNAVRVPQIGWNLVEDTPKDSPFADSKLAMAYYANSYVCQPTDVSVVTAWSTHEGDRFPAAVPWNNTIGVQFHPEKSSAAGVRFLHACLDEVLRSSVGQ